jgi:hypothetical protein
MAALPRTTARRTRLKSKLVLRLTISAEPLNFVFDLEFLTLDTRNFFITRRWMDQGFM